MRIAVAGTGLLGLSLIRPLLESSHEVVAVVQNGRAVRGFKRTLTETAGRFFTFNQSPVSFAAHNRIPTVWIDRLNDTDLAPLRALRPDLLLVGGFSIILKRSILDLPRIGCVNAHTSLLPKHRGPNPFSAVILAGETETGMTFHVIDDGIDTGPIIDQFAFAVEPSDSALDIHNKGCGVASSHIVEIVDRIERQGLQPIAKPQNNDIATYDKRLERRDAVIDWSKPARHIERLMRACKPFFIVKSACCGVTVLVTQITIDETPVNATPGVIIETRPFVRVATGRGVVTIQSAYCGRPFPWVWPNVWNRPSPGDKMG